MEEFAYQTSEGATNVIVVTHSMLDYSVIKVIDNLLNFLLVRELSGKWVNEASGQPTTDKAVK